MTIGYTKVGPFVDDSSPYLSAANLNTIEQGIKDTADAVDALGSAAASDTGDFATAAQGALADTAVQPSDTASTSAAGVVELATSAEAIAGSDSSRAVTPAALLAARRQVINAQTGTTYTIVLSDENKQVTLNNASPITVTLPQDSDVAIPVGGRVDFMVIGAGAVTFAAGTGATVNGTPSLVSRAQWSPLSAQKIAADTWVVMGDLESP